VQGGRTHGWYVDWCHTQHLSERVQGGHTMGTCGRGGHEEAYSIRDPFGGLQADHRMGGCDQGVLFHIVSEGARD